MEILRLEKGKMIIEEWIFWNILQARDASLLLNQILGEMITLSHIMKCIRGDIQIMQTEMQTVGTIVPCIQEHVTDMDHRLASLDARLKIVISHVSIVLGIWNPDCVTPPAARIQ